MAKSAGAAEYINSISAESKTLLKSVLDMALNNLMESFQGF